MTPEQRKNFNRKGGQGQRRNESREKWVSSGVDQCGSLRSGMSCCPLGAGAWSLGLMICRGPLIGTRQFWIWESGIQRDNKGGLLSEMLLIWKRGPEDLRIPAVLQLGTRDVLWSLWFYCNLDEMFYVKLYKNVKAFYFAYKKHYSLQRWFVDYNKLTITIIFKQF